MAPTHCSTPHLKRTSLNLSSLFCSRAPQCICSTEIASSWITVGRDLTTHPEVFDPVFQSCDLRRSHFREPWLIFTTTDIYMQLLHTIVVDIMCFSLPCIRLGYVSITIFVWHDHFLTHELTLEKSTEVEKSSHKEHSASYFSRTSTRLLE